MFFLTGPEAVVTATGKQISTLLQGKGGGRGGVFQGKTQALTSGRAAVVDLLKSTVARNDN